MMIIFFIIISLNFINADENNDNKFIETLPADVRKAFLAKVSRRILEEVPEVDTGEGVTDGEVINAKLEEQGEFVKKILREEIDSLKARRRNEDDNLEIKETENNGTIARSGKVEHIDLTLRAKSKRAGEDQINVTEVNNKEIVAKEEKVTTETVKSKDDKIQNDQRQDDTNKDSEITFLTEDNTLKDVGSKLEEKTDVVEKRTILRNEDGNNSSQNEDESKKIHNILDINKNIAPINNDVQDSPVVESKNINDIPVITNAKSLRNKEVQGKILNEDESKKINNMPETKKAKPLTNKDIKGSSTQSKNMDDKPEKIIVLKNKDSQGTSPVPESNNMNDIPKTEKGKPLRNKDVKLNTDKSKKESKVESRMLKNDDNKIPPSNVENSKKINNPPEPKSITIKESAPGKNINLKKLITEKLNDEGAKQKSVTENGEKKNTKEVETTKMIERNGQFSNDDSHEYLENNLSVNVAKKNNKDMTLTVKDTRVELKSIKKDPRNVNDNIPTITGITTTETPYHATAFTKLRNPNITSTKKESDKNIIMRTNDKNTANVNNNTAIEKPCNKTKTSNGTDCDEKSKVTTEETTTPVKIILHALRTSDTKAEASAEHFGDLRNGKEYQVYQIDENESPFVEVSRMDTKTDEQPHYFPVYNYEPRNAYYNAQNRLGPNTELDQRTDLREDMKGQEKHPEEHFVDLQVVRGYQVYEDEKASPFEVDNRAQNVEQPQYYPVYNYEPQYVYYNAFNRLGPNEDEVNIDDGNMERNRYVTNVDNDIESLVIDSKGLNERRSVKNKRKPNVEPNKFQTRRPKRYLPESLEADYLYQVINKGLKSNLEATRHILQGNHNFGQEGYIENEDLGQRSETKKKSFWEDTYETDKEFDTNEYISDDENVENIPIFLNNLRQNKALKVEWFKDKNKVEIDGEMFDLNDLKYGLKKSIVKTNQIEASRKPLDGLADLDKLSDQSKERLKEVDDEMYDKAIFHVLQLNRIRPDFINQTHRINIINTLNRLKRGLVDLSPKGNKTSKKEKYPKGYNKFTKPRSTILRFRVETESDEIEKYPYKLDTIDKIINITPEIDMMTNLEELLEKNIPITRSRDEDLEIHLKILKGLVEADDPALGNYDWLGTTVDIRAALTKLIDLVNRRSTLSYIHPADIQLLKFVDVMHHNALKLTLQNDTDKTDLPLISGLSNRLKMPKNHKQLPKSKREHINALKVINKLYKVRSASADNLEGFLMDLKNCLDDFHSLLKEISKITRFKNQRWYNNIKEIYLVKAGKKEYLEILLHLCSARLFELIEDSLKNGAEDNYMAYMRKNRAEVNRTEAEIMFILRILKAIKELN